jgi:hypothetical protein
MQCAVGAVVIEMTDVLIKNSVGVSRVVNQHSIGAFSADAADEPFRVAVRLGRAGRNLDDVDAFGGEDGIEGIGELRVPVADQKAEGADLVTEIHQEVAGGLGGPHRGRVSSHPEKRDPSGAHFMTNKTSRRRSPMVSRVSKIGGQQPGGLSAQEGPPPCVAPPWRRAQPCGGQNPPNRTRANVVPEPDQFSLKAPVAPGRILVCQAQHQSSDLLINWGAA